LLANYNRNSEFIGRGAWLSLVVIYSNWWGSYLTSVYLPVLGELLGGVV